VAAFPSGEGKRIVSVGGGSFPQWGDGELFYLSGRSMMSVSAASDDRTLDIGPAEERFEASQLIEAGQQPFFSPYTVAPDGRFLLAVSAQEAAPPIRVVLNWPALLGEN
jgi:hypothetical protein